MSPLEPMYRPALIEPIQAHPELPGVSYSWRVIGIAQGTDDYTAPLRHIVIREGARALELVIDGEVVGTNRVLRRLRRLASELECKHIVELEDRRLAAEVAAIDEHIAKSVLRVLETDPRELANLTPLPFVRVTSEAVCTVHIEGVPYTVNARPSEVESAMRAGFAAVLQPLRRDCIDEIDGSDQSRIELITVEPIE